MKGNHEGYQWVTKRRKDLEFRNDPRKVYEFMVTHPDRPNWGYRDSWTLDKGEYESTETGRTMTRQRDYAVYIIDSFVKRSLDHSIEFAKAIEEVAGE